MALNLHKNLSCVLKLKNACIAGWYFKATKRLFLHIYS